uniref:Peptidase S1 domain-containing protein n=1 Tax=Strigamia maritima TaxID=126957 RepID=T1JCW8_STRMM
MVPHYYLYLLAFLLLLLLLHILAAPLEINSTPYDLDVVTTLPSPRNDFLRIVSGVPARNNEFPYLVMLTRINGYVFCGGALISNYYVLTAAHCLENKAASGIVVRLGEYDWSTINDGFHVNFQVQNFILHPKFIRLVAYNDIAIIRLTSPVYQADTIKSICLPPNKSFAGEKATVAGWGATDINIGVPSHVLQKLDLQVLSQESCRSFFHGSSMYLNKDKLCAWAQNKDSCKGDSGGPLAWQNQSTKRHYLIGIISMGFRCGETNMPGLYTRITSYIDWIKSNTQNDTTICWS